MPMNVKPVPTLDNEINEIRLATAEIVNREILPLEGKLWGWLSDSANAPNEVVAEGKALRRQVQAKRPVCGRRICPASSAVWACRFCSTLT